MNRNARDTIAQYHMLGQGDDLSVGVSGGADSVALLHFLRGLAAELDLRLTVLHLNHCLRGAESDRDEAFVRRICSDWGIPLVVESQPVGLLARKQGLTVEQCAREERYAFFARHTPDGGKVATAHTLDDNAETVLLNLTRGTALRGLCGIPPVRDMGGVQIVRPLIGCSRGQVEAYCAAEGLAYVTDSTNIDDAYTRNRLRHRVMPVLRQLNPAWPAGVAGLTESLRADADYLDGMAAEALTAATRSPHSYDAAALAALPAPLALRTLRALLVAHSVPVSRRGLAEVAELLRSGGKMQLTAGWFCRVEAEELLFFAAESGDGDTFVPVELTLPIEKEIIHVFSHKKVKLIGLEYEISEKDCYFQEKLLKNVLDCDRIGRIVKMRQRLPGDRIRLAGRGCTKSLKKLFNEAGLSLSQRQHTLVLSDEDGPLWVEGFGVAEDARVRDNTRRALIVEIGEDAVCTQT